MKERHTASTAIDSSHVFEPLSREGQALLHIPGAKPLFMWLSATFLYCYQFFLRSSPNVMVDDLMHDFQVDAEALGILASFYYIAYSFLQIPMGIMIDKFGLRRILTFSALTCSLGATIFGISENLLTAKVGRLFIGIGSAGVFLSCLKLITLWFPKRHFGIFVGFTMMMGTFGAINAGAPLAFLVQSVGWRSAILSVAVVGAVWSLVLWMFVRDRKAPVGRKEEAPIPVFEGLRLILTNRQIWLAALYGSTMYSVLSGFADLWGASYLMHVYDLDRPAAAGTASTIYIGLALGGPVFGYMSERYKTRKLPMLLSPLGAVLFFSLLIYSGDLSHTTIYAFLFLVGFFVGGKLMNFAVATDSIPPALSGAATGLINTCAMLSGVIFQPFIGTLMCYKWEGRMLDGVAIYSNQDYCFALSVVPICMLLATLFTLMIKESYPK